MAPRGILFDLDDTLVDHDIHGAVAAGLRAVLLDRSGRYDGRTLPGVTRITRLRDLEAHVC